MKEIRLVVDDGFDADRFVEALLKGRIFWAERDNHWIDAMAVVHPAIDRLYQGGGPEEFLSAEILERRTYP